MSQQAQIGHPVSEEGLEEVYGPSIWESAAHAKIPSTAWEYHIRKQLNDAAYNHLEYVPYCSTMPVPQRCEEPKFMWVSCCRPERVDAWVGITVAMMPTCWPIHSSRI
ncbi:hypothetical protein Vafri_165 [Volvox africanus]|nr:hypothetical protein Vafri_165 [Volvox africanus]